MPRHGRLFAKLAGQWVTLRKWLAHQHAAEASRGTPGLAIPQFCRGNYSLHQSLILSFGKGQETFSLEFQGGWERYKRIKSLTDAFALEADELQLVIRLGAEYDRGLDVDGQDFQNMRDILSTLEVGKIQIEAVPAQEQEAAP